MGALHLAGRHDTTEAIRWASRMDRPSLFSDPHQVPGTAIVVAVLPETFVRWCRNSRATVAWSGHDLSGQVADRPGAGRPFRCIPCAALRPPAR